MSHVTLPFTVKFSNEWLCRDRKRNPKSSTDFPAFWPFQWVLKPYTQFATHSNVPQKDPKGEFLNTLVTMVTILKEGCNIALDGLFANVCSLK